MWVCWLTLALWNWVSSLWTQCSRVLNAFSSVIRLLRLVSAPCLSPLHASFSGFCHFRGIIDTLYYRHLGVNASFSIQPFLSVSVASLPLFTLTKTIYSRSFFRTQLIVPPSLWAFSKWKWIFFQWTYAVIFHLFKNENTKVLSSQISVVQYSVINDTHHVILQSSHLIPLITKSLYILLTRSYFSHSQVPNHCSLCFYQFKFFSDSTCKWYHTVFCFSV